MNVTRAWFFGAFQMLHERRALREDDSRNAGVQVRSSFILLKPRLDFSNYRSITHTYSRFHSQVVIVDIVCAGEANSDGMSRSE